MSSTISFSFLALDHGLILYGLDVVDNDVQACGLSQLCLKRIFTPNHFSFIPPLTTLSVTLLTTMRTTMISK
eukprot:10636715-Prorocentrum_lima.AAC.1